MQSAVVHSWVCRGPQLGLPWSKAGARDEGTRESGPGASRVGAAVADWCVRVSVCAADCVTPAPLLSPCPAPPHVNRRTSLIHYYQQRLALSAETLADLQVGRWWWWWWGGGVGGGSIICGQLELGGFA